MAKGLNLDLAKYEDGSIQVSWLDSQSNEHDTSAANMYLLMFVGSSMGGTIAAFNIGHIAPFLFGIGLSIVFLIMYRNPSSTPNIVTFEKRKTFVRGQAYPTQQITRFDYGLRSQLTGEQPARNAHGPVSEPTLIRMWLNDSNAVEVSANNWQQQINHQIQSALTQALEAIRDDDKQQEHEEVFGKVSSNTGMPDY